MRKKHKIGIVIDRFNVGGVEKIAIEQAKALREIGEEAYLLVLRRKGVIDDAFLDLRENVPTIYLDDRLPWFLTFSFKFPVFSFFSFFHITYPFLIPAVIQKKEFDYLIVHGTYTAFTAINIKKYKDISYSVFLWDPISYILNRVYNSKLSVFLTVFKLIANKLDASIINNADEILVGGDAHNALIKETNSKKKIYTITPSVHPIQKQQKKENYVLMVTAWKKGKNPEYVIEIVKNLPEIKIKMVGRWLDAEYYKEFTQLINKEKMNKNIEIIGEVTENQLADYYSQALILLQTNDDRGFGMPALEAAGHGTTFIIPEGQGVCNLFDDAIEGFYTREKDTEQIVVYLSKLLKDKELAKQMGQEGLTKVQKNYSWINHAKQLVKVAKSHS